MAACMQADQDQHAQPDRKAQAFHDLFPPMAICHQRIREAPGQSRRGLYQLNEYTPTVGALGKSRARKDAVSYALSPYNPGDPGNCNQAGEQREYDPSETRTYLRWTAFAALHA